MKSIRTKTYIHIFILPIKTSKISISQINGVPNVLKSTVCIFYRKHYDKILFPPQYHKKHKRLLSPFRRGLCSKV